MNSLLIGGRPASRQLGRESRRRKSNKLLTEGDYNAANIVSNGLPEIEPDINNLSLFGISSDWMAVRARFSVANTKMKKSEIQQTWHKYKSSVTVNDEEFKSPQKRSLEGAITAVQTKLNRYLNRNGITPDMKNRVGNGIAICTRALRRVHPNAPDDIKTLLKPWVGDKSGVYILGKGPNIHPKAGDAGKNDKRVVKMGQEHASKYIFMTTEEIICSGFVDYNDVEEFYNLGLPMFNGHHPEKKAYSMDKISRQFAEMMVFGLWEMMDNNIGEFIFQIPTFDMRWISDVSPMFEALGNLTAETSSTIISWTSDINDVFFVKSWPTVQSDLDNEPSVQHFVRDKVTFLKKDMSSWVVEDDLDGGFSDPYPTSPFKEDVQTSIDQLKVLLNQDVVKGEDIITVLNTIPKEEYYHPKNEERYAGLSRAHLEEKFSDTPTTRMIMMQHDVFDRLKTDLPWFERTFPHDQQIVISGSTRQLHRANDGQGERKVTSINAQDIIIYKTHSNHIVVVRGSSFLGLTLTATWEHRFNALRGLVDEGVVMYAIGMLSAEGLQLLQKKVLSCTMLLVGIGNSITRPDGSDRLARNFVLGEGISEGGLISGQKAMQDAVGGETNYWGLLLILNSLGHEDYNKMSNIIGGKDGSSVKIETTSDGKFMLYVHDPESGNFMPWHAHYDASKRHEYTTNSMKVLRKLGTVHIHQLVPELLYALFEGSNHTNNRDESRRNRLKELVLTVGNDSEIEDATKQMYVEFLMDLPDFDTPNSSPEQWMEMFRQLKAYKEQKQLDRIVNVEYGELDEYKGVSDWYRKQVGRRYKQGTTENHTPVTGLKRQMLDEINVEFNLETIEEEARSNQQEATAQTLAAMKARKAARKKANAAKVAEFRAKQG